MSVFPVSDLDEDTEAYGTSGPILNGQDPLDDYGRDELGRVDAEFDALYRRISQLEQLAAPPPSKAPVSLDRRPFAGDAPSSRSILSDRPFYGTLYLITGEARQFILEIDPEEPERLSTLVKRRRRLYGETLSLEVESQGKVREIIFDAPDAPQKGEREEKTNQDNARREAEVLRDLMRQQERLIDNLNESLRSERETHTEALRAERKANQDLIFQLQTRLSTMEAQAAHARLETVQLYEGRLLEAERRLIEQERTFRDQLEDLRDELREAAGEGSAWQGLLSTAEPLISNVIASLTSVAAARSASLLPAATGLPATVRPAAGPDQPEALALSGDGAMFFEEPLPIPVHEPSPIDVSQFSESLLYTFQQAIAQADPLAGQRLVEGGLAQYDQAQRQGLKLETVDLLRLFAKLAEFATANGYDGDRVASTLSPIIVGMRLRERLAQLPPLGSVLPWFLQKHGITTSEQAKTLVLEIAQRIMQSS